MKNFEFHNPTKLIFGTNTIGQLEKEIPKDARVLLLYGGGSIKANGIYDQVIRALAQHTFVEFGGVEANPRYETLMKAVLLMREQQLDYLLAVGGGSVIDGAKFMALAVPYQGEDPWDMLVNRTAGIQEKALPIGTVLTLPATGSEMNSNAVISRDDRREKLSFASPLTFPRFSILDPGVVASLPTRQLANGIVDAFVHTTEQYLTYPADAPLQDRIAEGILQTLIEVGPQVLKDPADTIAAGNFMWSCTMALNTLISKGVPTDWATHMIGHELTALYEIDHARTLAIILPQLWEVLFENKQAKLAQYAERVWKITEGTETEKALKAIEATRHFFSSLGVPLKLSDHTEDYAQTAAIITGRFEQRGWTQLGENGIVTPEKVKEIVERSY